MLEIRPSCEHCEKLLPYDSKEAMICTFECTFCQSCVDTILEGVCPNCKGNFVQRPIRPKTLLEKYPVSKKIVHKSVNLKKQAEIIQQKRQEIDNKG